MTNKRAYHLVTFKQNLKKTSCSFDKLYNDLHIIGESKNKCSRLELNIHEINIVILDGLH